MYIILEYYLLENFIINFLVLYVTNRITKSKIKVKGIIIGAIISTTYSLIIFLPSFLFLSNFIFKILISALIVYITFKSKSIKTFFYQWFCFYIVSFIFAGAIMSLSSNFSNIVKLLSKEIVLFKVFSYKHIFYGIIIAIFVSLIVFSVSHRKRQMEKLLVDVIIFNKDKKINLKALVDTGNDLKEPLSNRPVFVVELSKLLTILPARLIDFYKSKQYTNIENILADLADIFPLTLVPFKSIGNESGIILGFKPDSIVIKLPNDEELELSNIIIGIYDGYLSDESEFSGLINYESIIEKEEIWINLNIEFNYYYSG